MAAGLAGAGSPGGAERGGARKGLSGLGVFPLANIHASMVAASDPIKHDEANRQGWQFGRLSMRRRRRCLTAIAGPLTQAGSRSGALRPVAGTLPFARDQGVLAARRQSRR
jgi:hypothetical protein